MTTAVLEPGAPSLQNGGAQGETGSGKLPGQRSKLVLKHSPTLLFDILVRARRNGNRGWSLAILQRAIAGFRAEGAASVPPAFSTCSRYSYMNLHRFAVMGPRLRDGPQQDWHPHTEPSPPANPKLLTTC